MTQNYPKNVRNLDAFWHLKLAKSIHGLAYAVTMALGGGVCRAGVSGEEGSGVLTPLGHVTVPPPPPRFVPYPAQLQGGHGALSGRLSRVRDWCPSPFIVRLGVPGVRSVGQ